MLAQVAVQVVAVAQLQDGGEGVVVDLEDVGQRGDVRVAQRLVDVVLACGVWAAGGLVGGWAVGRMVSGVGCAGVWVWV